MFSRNFETLKSSSDASDGLYGADPHRVVEAVLNNSLPKGNLHAGKVPARIIASQYVQESISRPNLGVFPIPNRVKKSRPTYWTHQNKPNIR